MILSFLIFEVGVCYLLFVCFASAGPALIWGAVVLLVLVDVVALHVGCLL